MMYHKRSKCECVYTCSLNSVLYNWGMLAVAGLKCRPLRLTCLLVLKCNEILPTLNFFH
jgi:hypothetical protein